MGTGNGPADHFLQRKGCGSQHTHHQGTQCHCQVLCQGHDGALRRPLRRGDGGEGRFQDAQRRAEGRERRGDGIKAPQKDDKERVLKHGILRIWQKERERAKEYIKEQSEIQKTDLKFAKDIIEDAKNKTNLNDNSVYSFIVSAYNKEMSSMNQNKSQEQSMGKELTLTRNNPKISGYQLFDENENYLKKLNENQKMNIAGYTSIILIVATAITFGMYLAINFLP